MKTFSRSFMTTLIFALSIGFTSLAYAQDDVPDGGAAGIASVGFTSVSTTWSLIFTVPVGLTVLVVVLLLRSSSEMETYIKDNNVALQHDLHMGGGQTTTELATFFNVPADQHGAFAQVLSESRDELLPLTDVNTITPERAGTFVRVIYDAMMEKPELARHLPRVAG